MAFLLFGALAVALLALQLDPLTRPSLPPSRLAACAPPSRSPHTTKPTSVHDPLSLGVDRGPAMAGVRPRTCRSAPSRSGYRNEWPGRGQHRRADQLARQRQLPGPLGAEQQLRARRGHRDQRGPAEHPAEGARVLRLRSASGATALTGPRRAGSVTARR